MDRRGREPNVVCNRIMTLDQADKEFTSQVAIKFDRGLHALDDVENVRKVLSRYPGSTDVVLVVDSFDPNQSGAVSSKAETVEADDPEGAQTAQEENHRVRFILTTSKECQVSVGPEFQQALKDAIGEEFYELKVATSSNGSGGSVGR